MSVHLELSRLVSLVWIDDSGLRGSANGAGCVCWNGCACTSCCLLIC